MGSGGLHSAQLGDLGMTLGLCCSFHSRRGVTRMVKSSTFFFFFCTQLEIVLQVLSHALMGFFATDKAGVAACPFSEGFKTRP
jgi:hypothetical protein